MMRSTCPPGNGKSAPPAGRGASRYCLAGNACFRTVVVLVLLLVLEITWEIEDENEDEDEEEYQSRSFRPGTQHGRRSRSCALCCHSAVAVGGEDG
jgi:hypothetical protein